MEKLIGITMGDIAGVGPELILKVIKDYPNSIIYGSIDILNYYNDKYSYNYNIKQINDINDFNNKCINVIDPLPISINDFEIGKVSSKCGKRAFLYLQKAIEDALDHKITAIVTCPLNKEALHLGGYNYAGHTEILAQLTNTKEYAMLLWSDKLKTIHVSTHCSLLEAINRCKKDRIVTVTKLAYDTLVKAGYSEPRIAIAGLNPHAGENGLFGKEEINEIIPAIKELNAMGIKTFGPLPPDTVYLKCMNNEFDLVVSQYHDQGHIPLKLLDFNGGVNMSVGLPIIRTSVDHGTAFDIAGTNVCNPHSLIQAITIAYQLS